MAAQHFLGPLERMACFLHSNSNMPLLLLEPPATWTLVEYAWASLIVKALMKVAWMNVA